MIERTFAAARGTMLGAVGLALLGLGTAHAVAAAQPQAPSAASSTSAETSRIWYAPATTTVEAEEREFHNGDTRLVGTLYRPRSARPVPVLVVTHGASSPLRELPLYRHLVQMLPPMGMAVFVYDRRGAGASGGDLKSSDYAMLADDAIAAQKMLAADPAVDGKRIGFWGLSQGGWLALLAATRSPQTAFAISVSAPMTTPDKQMNFASANILRIHGYDETAVQQALAVRGAVDAYMRGETDRQTAQKALSAAVTQPWFDLIYMSRTLGDPKTSRWVKEMRHDPMETASKVTTPALVIYGSADPWVPAAESVKRLAAIAADRPNLETVVIAGADHSMSLTATPMEQVDPAFFPQHAPDAPAYFAVLASWLARQGIVP